MPGSSSDSGPIPRSQPSSAPDGAEARRGTVLPLVLAIAAGASCWNLLGAPFALVTAVIALALALRASAGGGAARTRVRVAAAISGLALAAAVVVIVNAFRGAQPGAAVPGARTPAEDAAADVLDEEERETEARRDAARRELERQLAPGEESGGAQR